MRVNFSSILSGFPHVAAAGLLCSTLTAWSADLPAGQGRDIVAAKCNLCHALEARVGSGYTAEGWNTVLRMMVNQGAPLTPADVAEIKPYLIKNFPEKGKPAAVIVPGPTEVSMQIWKASTPGARPHDALATRDGAYWYTGQMANVLGRVDPKTGQVKEFPLKTSHSGPHGLMEDRDGNIWFTGNTGALIGKLDPRTGIVTEIPMPDPVKDPHTLVFDASGILWFTAQNSNRVGRIDPMTNEVKLLTLPTAGARPYGMTVSSKGTIYIAEFGTNGIAAINPATLEVREYKLPNPASRPRRVTITSDDIIWYTDYPRGYLGRLDPATGQVTEWQSPSGAKSAPYGISAIKDVIWYSESETTPSTVVRFDPKTQKFQSWAIPGGGNIVRNTSVTTEGNFLLANSLVNTLTLVKIQK
jgi:virginiamycin B lyase